MFRSTWSVVFAHLLGWLLFLSLPLLFAYNQPGRSIPFSNLLLPNHLFFYTFYIALFYLNSRLLVPLLYLQKKFLLYFLCVFFLLALSLWLKPFDRLMDQPNRSAPFNFKPAPPPRDAFLPNDSGAAGKGSAEFFPPRMPQSRNARLDVVSIYLCISILAMSLSLRLGREWDRSRQQVAVAEAGKANAELSFLKAQINPHFLFNTLNNIYSLAVMKHEHTAESIMKLSQIMRYVTDDATVNFVALQGEISCIGDYIDLQKLRLGNKTDIEFTVDGDATGIVVAPLIMMSFVENLFKYGISSHESSPLGVHISITSDQILFSCSNKIFNPKNKQERTGIGISNTRNRLEHIYPHNYRLDINQDGGFFNVSLQLPALRSNPEHP